MRVGCRGGRISISGKLGALSGMDSSAYWVNTVEFQLIYDWRAGAFVDLVRFALYRVSGYVITVYMNFPFAQYCITL